MMAELRKAPPAGTPVCCALLGGLEEHSGIYIGRGTVAELHGDGFVQRVSLSEFLNGTYGPSPRSGLRIHAACDKASGCPLASPEVAARTRRVTPAKGKKKPLSYDVLYHNCHRFTAGCVSGRFGGGRHGVSTASRLLEVVSQCLNNGRPVVWRPVNASTPGFEYAPTPGKIVFKTALEIGKEELFGTAGNLLDLAVALHAGPPLLELGAGEG